VITFAVKTSQQEFLTCFRRTAKLGTWAYVIINY
jgi:hypothetical protein